MVEVDYVVPPEIAISYEGDLIDKGIEFKLVQKAGSWLSIGDTKIGQGREAAKVFLRQNPAVAKELEKAIWVAVEAEDKATMEGR